MSQNNVVIDILNSCKTSTELHNVLNKLRLLNSSLYTLNFDLDNFLSSQLPEQIGNMLLDMPAVSSRDRKAITEFVTNLQNDLLSAETIKITLAFNPDAYFVARLYEWFSTVVGVKKFILDVVFDRSIISGVIVSYKGKYIDESVQSRLNSAFVS